MKPISADPVTARSFIDTNVLPYADASDEPTKQRAALALIKQLYDGACGVLSTQVLQEYGILLLVPLLLPLSACQRIAPAIARPVATDTEVAILEFFAKEHRDDRSGQHTHQGGRYTPAKSLANPTGSGLFQQTAQS